MRGEGRQRVNHRGEHKKEARFLPPLLSMYIAGMD
jgi:hypothetical protein